MRIKHIHVRRQSLALQRPYSIAYKTISEVENILVVVETTDGRLGLGTANPSQNVVGKTLDDTFRALDQSMLARFIGKDVREIGGLLEELRRAYPENPGARAALDIAFHDLFSQGLGLPLVKYFGAQYAAMPTSVTIGIKDLDATLDEAAEYLGKGFRALKVKLGNYQEVDVERLEKIRERFGKDFHLRVDANQAYTVTTTRWFLEATKHLDIELIEQPLPAADRSGWLQFTPEERIRLAADEALVTPAQAVGLAFPQAHVGIFNIKLMKTGGIAPARFQAEVARNANIDLMWGCNDESVISISAALHTALATPNTRYLDLDGSFDLGKDFATGGFAVKDGLLVPLDLPGLGLKLIA